jgi:antitoxin HicB
MTVGKIEDMTSGTVPLTRGYAIELYEEDDGTWTALVPDLPGCVAAGDSAPEALDEVGDAIDAWIESARADGAPVPSPSRGDDEYSGRFVARVPKSLHRALASRASREGVSLNTLCVTALTQVATQGLFETELARLAVARATRAGIPGPNLNAIDLWADLGTPLSDPAGHGTHVQFSLAEMNQPRVPAGMADAMRAAGTVRA